MTNTLVLAALALSATADYQTQLDQLRIEQQVPGVSAVITVGNEVIFAGASGLADLRTGRAMAADTLVYAGSLSKVFTAVLVLQLVEAEKLTLDEPVDGIATDSPSKYSAITVAHLLTHAAGLEREGDFNYWFSGVFPDRAALAGYLQSARLRSPPGKSLHYSNVGYAKLGLVIEAKNAMSYGQTLRHKLLEPLGMGSTGTPGPVARIAAGYTPVGRVIPDPDHPFAGVGNAVDDRHLREYHDAQAMGPAFGIYSTANDLARLTRFLLGHGGDDVLSSAMRGRLRSRQHLAGG